MISNWKDLCFDIVFKFAKEIYKMLNYEEHYDISKLNFDISL